MTIYTTQVLAAISSGLASSEVIVAAPEGGAWVQLVFQGAGVRSLRVEARATDASQWETETSITAGGSSPPQVVPLARAGYQYRVTKVGNVNYPQSLIWFGGATRQRLTADDDSLVVANGRLLRVGDLAAAPLQQPTVPPPVVVVDEIPTASSTHLILVLSGPALLAGADGEAMLDEFEEDASGVLLLDGSDNPIPINNGDGTPRGPNVPTPGTRARSPFTTNPAPGKLYAFDAPFRSTVRGRTLNGQLDETFTPAESAAIKVVGFTDDPLDFPSQMACTLPALIDKMVAAGLTQSVTCVSIGDNEATLASFARAGWVNGAGAAWPTVTAGGPNGDNAVNVIAAYKRVFAARNVTITGCTILFAQGASGNPGRNALWGVDALALFGNYRTLLQTELSLGSPPDVIMVQPISSKAAPAWNATTAQRGAVLAAASIPKTTTWVHGVPAPYYGTFDGQSGVNWTFNGRLLVGGNLAEALFQIMFGGSAWVEPTIASVAFVNPRLLRVVFARPPTYGPLQIDTSYLTQAIAANAGLRITDATFVEKNVITSVALSSVTDAVDIALSADLLNGDILHVGTFAPLANQWPASRTSLYFAKAAPNPWVARGLGGGLSFTDTRLYVHREEFTLVSPPVTTPIDTLVSQQTNLSWWVGAAPADRLTIDTAVTPNTATGLKNRKAASDASNYFTATPVSVSIDRAAVYRANAAAGGFAAAAVANEPGLEFYFGTGNANARTDIYTRTGEPGLIDSSWTIAAAFALAEVTRNYWLFGQNDPNAVSPNLAVGLRVTLLVGVPTLQLRYGTAAINGPAVTVGQPLLVFCEFNNATRTLQLRVNGVDYPAVVAGAQPGVVANPALAAFEIGTSGGSLASFAGKLAAMFRWNDTLLSTPAPRPRVDQVEQWARETYPTVFTF